MLENRPLHAEVIVVLNDHYDDPYDLGDEVRFVESPRGAGWAECVNLGVQHSQGAVVHPLACGVHATQGWADAALDCFAENQKLASVAPLVIDRENPSLALSAGVRYATGGRRVICGANLPIEKSARRSASRLLGPTLLAGFYLRAAWERVGGLATNVGDCYADIDLALRLRLLGFGAVLERSSIVRAGQPRLDYGAFRDGLYAERLFLRNVTLGGWAASLLLHPFTVGGDCLSRFPNLPGALASLAGRCVAWFGLPGHLRHHRQAAGVNDEDEEPTSMTGALRPALRPETARPETAHTPTSPHDTFNFAQSAAEARLSRAPPRNSLSRSETTKREPEKNGDHRAPRAEPIRGRERPELATGNVHVQRLKCRLRGVDGRWTTGLPNLTSPALSFHAALIDRIVIVCVGVQPRGPIGRYRQRGLNDPAVSG